MEHDTNAASARRHLEGPWVTFLADNLTIDSSVPVNFRLTLQAYIVDSLGHTSSQSVVVIVSNEVPWLTTQQEAGEDGRFNASLALAVHPLFARGQPLSPPRPAPSIRAS